MSPETKKVLDLGEAVAADTIELIVMFCNEADGWRRAAHALNDKILAFRKASVELERRA